MAAGFAVWSCFIAVVFVCVDIPLQSLALPLSLLPPEFPLLALPLPLDPLLFPLPASPLFPLFEVDPEPEPPFEPVPLDDPEDEPDPLPLDEPELCDIAEVARARERAETARIFVSICLSSCWLQRSNHRL